MDNLLAYLKTVPYLAIVRDRYKISNVNVKTIMCSHVTVALLSKSFNAGDSVYDVIHELFCGIDKELKPEAIEIEYLNGYELEIYVTEISY